MASSASLRASAALDMVSLAVLPDLFSMAFLIASVPDYLNENGLLKTGASLTFYYASLRLINFSSSLIFSFYLRIVLF